MMDRVKKRQGPYLSPSWWRSGLLALVLALSAPWRAEAAGLKDVLKKVFGEAAQQGAKKAAKVLLSRNRDSAGVLAQVVQHLHPTQGKEVKELLERARSGGTLSEAEWGQLEKVAQEVEEPLKQAVESLKKGEKVPWLGLREQNARVLELGSVEHEAQCWVEYQLRHHEKYPEFSYEVEETWRKRYRSIIENEPKGNGFELEVLKAQGYAKNQGLLMPPPGSAEEGFKADALKEAVEELVWGRPYKFVEVKAWNELSHTGNVKAMIRYIREHGGSLELWIRSAKHPDGATRLSEPLLKELQLLESRGMAAVKYFP